jgi:hypothetical protein
MKYNTIILFILLISLIISCSSSNDDPTSASESHTVSGVGRVVTVNSTNKTHLTISGRDNTIYIESNLGNLIVSGVNNLLTFSDDISVDRCIVSGENNIAQNAQNNDTVIMSCVIGGVGNSGFK